MGTSKSPISAGNQGVQRKKSKQATPKKKQQLLFDVLKPVVKFEEKQEQVSSSTASPNEVSVLPNKDSECPKKTSEEPNKEEEPTNMETNSEIDVVVETNELKTASTIEVRIGIDVNVEDLKKQEGHMDDQENKIEGNETQKVQNNLEKEIELHNEAAGVELLEEIREMPITLEPMIVEEKIET